MNKKEIYQQAVEKWGETLQLILLMEECGELIQVISKYLRHGDKHNLQEEMVDVEIMLEQNKINHGEDGVAYWKMHKLKKLQSLLDNKGDADEMS